MRGARFFIADGIFVIVVFMVDVPFIIVGIILLVTPSGRYVLLP